MRAPWIVAAALALLHVGLSHAGRGGGPRTYVFTPLVDVVPGGVPLSGSEAASLAAEAKNRVDARDIQSAYARLGSTISLDDLLRGVEALDEAGVPLDGGQRERVATILSAAQADHAAVAAVQGEILDLEAKLDREVGVVLDALPPEARARVLARVASNPRAPAGPSPGGAPSGGALTPPGAAAPGAPTPSDAREGASNAGSLPGAPPLSGARGGSGTAGAPSAAPSPVQPAAPAPAPPAAPAPGTSGGALRGGDPPAPGSEGPR